MVPPVSLVAAEDRMRKPGIAVDSPGAADTVTSALLATGRTGVRAAATTVPVPVPVPTPATSTSSRAIGRTPRGDRNRDRNRACCGITTPPGATEFVRQPL